MRCYFGEVIPLEEEVKLLNWMFDFGSMRERRVLSETLFIGALKFFKYSDNDIEYIKKIKPGEKEQQFCAVHSEQDFYHNLRHQFKELLAD